MKRYTIVIEVDDEEEEWVQDVVRQRRNCVRSRAKVVLESCYLGLDLIEGDLIDFRPARSKVDLRETNERLKSE